MALDKSLRVLSVIPPMTQLNTPYPSTAYLTGFLRSVGVDAVQADLALALVLRLFSAQGLLSIRQCISALPAKQHTPLVRAFDEQFDRYHATIDSLISFLQGRDPTLAHRIAGRCFLPEGPRFDALDTYADEFVRYAESLAQSQASFEPLAKALAAPPTLVDVVLSELTAEMLERHLPRVVLISVPFPGAVYAAFRIAQKIKALDASIVTVLGGGYVNTELRELSESRVFDYFDYVTLDDGERPILALLEHLNAQRPREKLVRTFARDRDTNAVIYVHSGESDVAFADIGTPTWDGLPIGQYLSLLDMLNPMHRLWSDGRWNKLTVAHGCYWKKCSFCDVSLDYIARYETASATLLVERIEAIIAETGQSGFHFVDEAAPPKALKSLADELRKRGRSISWWGNIRFEKSFTPELCEQLADSGCIAISGGLEVASDRLLALMKKGVSVAQVAQVTRAFSKAGILVHAYLMYGFPTQTVQDTVDALEYVRQLFLNGCIQSGYFHRFACTVHSPVGMHPEEYGVTLKPLTPGTFARNDVEFIDPTGVDHTALGLALNKALYNYMHGVGLEDDVRTWFAPGSPKARVARNFIAKALVSRQ
jgi:radical SAM superfamily enzyme YgiQ (UPF0313 family)